ncbi:hypothetical protein ACQEUU_36925 [Nonomuraea sp. CA-218870]|uniref:hypothetical protein n=1 Tax=Nonomuraea sp. CA-218870 TaxID=3239998 RepID=UPI003D8C0129
MDKSTTLAPEATTEQPVLGVIEYRVRYTCRDEGGDQQRTEDWADGIHDAHLMLAERLAYQERWDLPEDAHIVFRIGGQGPWLRWGGESR